MLFQEIGIQGDQVQIGPHYARLWVLLGYGSSWNCLLCFTSIIVVNIIIVGAMDATVIAPSGSSHTR